LATISVAFFSVISAESQFHSLSRNEDYMNDIPNLLKKCTSRLTFRETYRDECFNAEYIFKTTQLHQHLLSTKSSSKIPIGPIEGSYQSLFENYVSVRRSITYYSLLLFCLISRRPFKSRIESFVAPSLSNCADTNVLEVQSATNDYSLSDCTNLVRSSC
jgi:hypothetical protein